jgi:hypothetical protein
MTVALPSGWEWSSERDGLSIFRTNGVGAIQISVLIRDTQGHSQSEDSHFLAIQCARDRRWNISEVELHNSVIDGCPVSEFAHIERSREATYWQVWHIVGSRHAAFVTYTCDAADADTERAERTAIVESLRWR